MQAVAPSWRARSVAEACVRDATRVTVSPGTSRAASPCTTVIRPAPAKASAVMRRDQVPARRAITGARASSASCCTTT